MKIRFKSYLRQIIINDEAKTHNKFMIVFIILQIITSSIQVVERWNEFDNWTFYFFVIMFTLMCVAFIYFLFYNSSQDIIKHDDVQYFKTKNILGVKLRYLKLHNGKTRLLNFKGNSKEIQALKQYLGENEITIKS